MKKKHSHRNSPINTSWQKSPFSFEALEGRRLLSASLHHSNEFGHGGNRGQLSSSIEFTQAPAAVQSGLDTLATADGLTAPAADSTQTVFLANTNGTETYSITLRGTGTRATLTVDQNGNPVTSPTVTKSTWATLNGTGDGSNAAAAAEITTLATALNLTAPADTTKISVSTASDGSVIYTINLKSTTTVSRHSRSTTLSVDGNGNPVGNETVPFSALPAAIQSGLNAVAPSGSTALDASSTQSVRVRTVDGVVTYTATYSASGTDTDVTVDLTGTAANLPSTTTDTFSNIPANAQTGLQALATARSAGTIDPTQSVTVYSETNGATVYSASLTATTTDNNGHDHTRRITVTVDADGNPTVVPTSAISAVAPIGGGHDANDDNGDDFGGGQGRGRGRNGNDDGPGHDAGDDNGGGNSSGSGSSSSGSTTTTSTAQISSFGRNASFIQSRF